MDFIKLHDLIYFNKLVELKSYTAVSEYFGVSQPTISMSVKRLEQEFNVELINRNQAHHQIKVNKYGKILYKHTEIIAEQMAEMKRDMQHNFDQPIRFGLPPIIGNYYFPSLASQLNKSGILTHLDNIEAGSEKLLEQLKNGEIDIALLGSNHPLKNNAIKAKILCENNFKIIVSLNSPLAKLDKIRIADLNNCNFILLSKDFVHTKTLQQLLKMHSVHVNTRYHTQDVELVKRLVSQNVGISFLTSTAITKNDHVVAIPIDDDDLEPFYVSIAYRKSHVLSPQEQELVNILTNSIQTEKNFPNDKFGKFFIF